MSNKAKYKGFFLRGGVLKENFELENYEDLYKNRKKYC